MNRSSLPGVCITQGPINWQILQRRLDNKVDIPLSGTWLEPDNKISSVEVRLSQLNSQSAVNPQLDWQKANTSPNRTWSHVLRDVPAGGLYRIETRLSVQNENWCLNGETIHYIGVGDLWLIAGEGNAVGFGHGRVMDPPELGVHVFKASEEWSLADHPIHDATKSRKPANFIGGQASHSPWLTFAKILHKRLGIPIGLIPAAHTSSKITDWLPDEYAAPNFYNALENIRIASSFRQHNAFDLGDGGPVFLPTPGGLVGGIAGVLWYQGCSDTVLSDDAKKYALHFARLVKCFRGALDAPELPFITCQLNKVNGIDKSTSSRNWGIVREAQRAASYDIPQVAVIPTLDVALTNGLHCSASGNTIIGERSANAALGMVYGVDLPWRCPDFSEIKFLKQNKLLLVFANVSGSLWTQSKELDCFYIYDEQGGAAIRKIEIIAPCSIKITLNRPLGIGAKISCCADHQPESLLLDGDNVPVLAFSDIPIANGVYE